MEDIRGRRETQPTASFFSASCSWNKSCSFKLLACSAAAALASSAAARRLRRSATLSESAVEDLSTGGGVISSIRVLFSSSSLASFPGADKREIRQCDSTGPNAHTPPTAPMPSDGAKEVVNG